VGRLTGRGAIVTGAASGNGLAIARRFLADGAAVVFVDVDEAGLRSVVPERDPRAIVFVGDVSSEEAARAAVSAAVESFGSLDVLVNNAGIVRLSEFSELPLEEWDQVFRVNVTGALLFSQAAVTAMRRMPSGSNQDRSIINITSAEGHIVAASSGHPQVHYNASKGALHMLTRALAVELAPHRIRVNEIAPGVIETPLTAKVLSTEEGRRFWLERTPLGRVGKPEDVASAASFLASDDASFVTGATLFVDGGYTVL
jgi:NAD(P)-dependent dehydrogenase (short-subunit alcohol dehydrogenase family)